MVLNYLFGMPPPRLCIMEVCFRMAIEEIILFQRINPILWRFPIKQLGSLFKILGNSLLRFSNSKRRRRSGSGKRNFDFSQFFNGKLDLANLLPSNNGNEFVTDRFVDPTMGGMLPDWTQRLLSEELYSEEFIKMKPIFNGTISNNEADLFRQGRWFLWGMGENVDGALGVGKSVINYIPNKNYSLYDSKVDHATPVLIVSSGVKSVVAAKYHTIFLKKDGSLWGMGWNGSGALGNGKSEYDYRDQDADGIREAFEVNPIRIVSEKVVNFAVSDYETWFVKENGSLWKVGDGDYSNISAPNSNLLPQMVLSSGGSS